MGLLHVYCGDGKGKTSAAMGLSLRMAGCGKKVVIVRFLKNEESGEIKALRSFPEVEVLPCEKCFGFSWTMTEEEKELAAQYCAAQFQKACERAEVICRQAEGNLRDLNLGDSNLQDSSQEPDVLLVFDELCAALNGGFLALSSVLDFLKQRPANLEVVLTGRRPPKELLACADYVTELQMQAHPYTRGITARRGIEY